VSITPVDWDKFDFANGQHYLANGESEWSLWRHIGGTRDDMLIGWNGMALDEPAFHNDSWGDSDGVTFFYPLTPEQADTCFMAAKHLPHEQAWYDFARRLVLAGEAPDA